MQVPFVDLKKQYQSIKQLVDQNIQAVIDNTSFIGGEPVFDFEKNFASLYGVKHCISVANGTDSLYIIMKMLGIGPGDEVITAANSWISSSETITQTGARPVFVDIHPDYYSMDERLLEKAITAKTKAVIAVHLHGQVCDIETISSICREKGIFLIEDCAQSHFSEFGEIRAGTFGVAGSFSFYPGKNLGAYGDAGCIITNDDDLAMKCKMYARHGALKKHQHEIEGINSRMDGLQAAVLNAKLPYILEWTEQRIANADRYIKALAGTHDVALPAIRPGSKHTFHLFVIRTKRRDQLKDYLNERGIETAIHYPAALPFLKAYEYLGHKPADFPVAYAYQSEILSLPMYPELGEAEIAYVCDAVNSFFTEAIIGKRLVNAEDVL